MTIPLQVAISEFLIALQADGAARSTVRWYTSLLKQYSDSVSGKTIKQVTATDVRKYIIAVRESHYADDTKHGTIRAIHRFWAWVSVEYGTDNPMRNIKYPKQPEPTPGKAADLTDAARLFAYLIGDEPLIIRDRALVAFLIATGARAGGVVGLQVRDLDLGRRRALVTEKGGKKRTVFFDLETQGDLRRWQAVRDPDILWFFYNVRTGKPLTANGLLQIMYKRGHEAGCTGKVNPHAWRHAFGIGARKQQMDTINLSSLMGHEDMQVTADYYAQLNIVDDLQAVYDEYAPRLKIKMSSI